MIAKIFATGLISLVCLSRLLATWNIVEKFIFNKKNARHRFTCAKLVMLLFIHFLDDPFVRILPYCYRCFKHMALMNRSNRDFNIKTRHSTQLFAFSIHISHRHPNKKESN